MVLPVTPTRSSRKILNIYSTCSIQLEGREEIEAVAQQFENDPSLDPSKLFDHYFKKLTPLALDHLERRIQFFFFQLVLCYNTNYIYRLGKTLLQGGKGKRFSQHISTEAAHSALLPCLRYQENNNLRTISDNDWKSFLPGSHYFRTMNATVELLSIFNKIDSQIDCGLTKKGIVGLRYQGVKIINQASKAKNIEGLEDCFFNFLEELKNSVNSIKNYYHNLMISSFFDECEQVIRYYQRSFYFCIDAILGLSGKIYSSTPIEVVSLLCEKRISQIHKKQKVESKISLLFANLRDFFANQEEALSSSAYDQFFIECTLNYISSKEIRKKIRSQYGFNALEIFQKDEGIQKSFCNFLDRLNLNNEKEKKIKNTARRVEYLSQFLEQKSCPGELLKEMRKSMMLSYSCLVEDIREQGYDKIDERALEDFEKGKITLEDDCLYALGMVFHVHPSLFKEEF